MFQAHKFQHRLDRTKVQFMWETPHMGSGGWSQGRDSLAAPRVNGEQAAQAVEGTWRMFRDWLAVFDSGRQKLACAVWLGVGV